MLLNDCQITRTSYVVFLGRRHVHKYCLDNGRVGAESAGEYADGDRSVDRIGLTSQRSPTVMPTAETKLIPVELLLNVLPRTLEPVSVPETAIPVEPPFTTIFEIAVFCVPISDTPVPRKPVNVTPEITLPLAPGE